MSMRQAACTRTRTSHADAATVVPLPQKDPTELDEAEGPLAGISLRGLCCGREAEDEGLAARRPRIDDGRGLDGVEGREAKTPAGVPGAAKDKSEAADVRRAAEAGCCCWEETAALPSLLLLFVIGMPAACPSASRILETSVELSWRA